MKKILSLVLATAMISASVVNVFAAEPGAIPGDYEYINDAERDYVENVLNNRTYNEYNDTSVFEGRKTYLIQDNFVEIPNASYQGQAGEQSMPAGWNIDRRAGGVRSDNKILNIYDASDVYRTYMTHDLMPHKSGDLTLETGFVMKNTHRDGLFFELSGEGKTILKLETKGENLCYQDKEGKLVSVAKYTPEVLMPIKAIVHPETKKVDIITDGGAKYGIPFVESAAQVDNVSIGTSEKGQMYANIPCVHVYINYIVNERFITTAIGKTPYDFKLSQTGIKNTGTVETQAQRGDVNSYQLSTSSILTVPYLTKNYQSNEKKLITEFAMLIPEKKDGIKASVLSGKDEVISIISKDEDLVLSNGEVLYENYYKNFWYRFKIITDTEKGTADVYVNYRKYAESVPLKGNGQINGVEFTSGTAKGNSMMIDDILVYPDLPLPEGYPTEPRTVTPDKNIKEVGMMMYSMWREGFHFGWDRLSPYTERQPYLGYYTEGDGESADWSIKWQKEHGVTYQIYTWSCVERTEDVPIKRPIRSQVWLDGLHEAQFDMDWCLMWSTPNAKTIRGLDDFKNNILPFWVEYAWKDPNYKRIDNKLLLYTYDVYKIRDLLGGIDAMNEAIALMNEEAKKLGADGVMFVASEGGNFSNEEATQLGMYRYTYGWSHGGSSDSSIVMSGVANHMEKNDYRLYIPSIPMGFETSPWRSDGIGGFMTVAETTEMLNYLNENSQKWTSLGNKASDMVVLTCWDEYGEGHYYCPSQTHGFGYMNAVRDTLTTKGVLVDEHLPSKQSYARMGVLYPMGRQSLKLMKDNRETDKPQADDSGAMTLLKKYDFSNPADFAKAEASTSTKNLRQENGMMVFECLGADPQVYINDVSVPANKIKSIRITASQPASGTNTVYYQTSVDPQLGKNYKRFTGAMSANVMQEAMLYPADEKMLTGTLTRLRIDPPDSTVGTMYVKFLEIFGSNEQSIGLELDGSAYDLNAPLITENGTSFMPIYQYFNAKLLVPCYWYKAEGRLHIEYDGKTIELFDGKKEYTINGSKRTLKNAPFYKDGNFYAPIREFFTELGYNVDWNNDEQKVVLQSPVYIKNLEVADDPQGVWTFSKDGNNQGWKPNWNASLAPVKDGDMQVNIIANPAIVSLSTSIKADDYKTLTIRLKNSSNATTMRFFYTSDLVKTVGSPNGYIMEISANDSKYKEYKIDLKSVPGYGGTLNMIRFDFVDGNSGTVYVDQISLEK